MHRVPPSTGRFWSMADRQAAGLALGLHRAVRRAGDDLGRVLGASLDKGVVLELGSAACRKSMGAPGAPMTRPQAHEAGPGCSADDLHCLVAGAGTKPCTGGYTVATWSPTVRLDKKKHLPLSR